MKTAEQMPEVVGKIPTEVMAVLKEKLQLVESSLLSVDANMKEHLRESHRLLISYPETVHLLDDAEIHNLLEAAQKLTNQRIVADTAKKKTAGKSKPSIDDI